MEHHFTKTEDGSLWGSWLTKNGQLFCKWRWDAEHHELYVTRGLVTRVVSIPADPASLPSSTGLADRMKDTAKAIAEQIGPDPIE